jgi:hypothetical protein
MSFAIGEAVGEPETLRCCGIRENAATGVGSKTATRRCSAASRHSVVPNTDHFPMSEINHAFARLESGKARYRIVWTRISDSLFAIEGMRDQSF